MGNNNDAGVKSLSALRGFAQNLDGAQRELVMICRWLNVAIADVCQTWDDKQLAEFKPKFDEKTMTIGELSVLIKKMSEYVNLYCDGVERYNNVRMGF